MSSTARSMTRKYSFLTVQQLDALADFIALAVVAKDTHRAMAAHSVDAYRMADFIEDFTTTFEADTEELREALVAVELLIASKKAKEETTNG